MKTRWYLVLALMVCGLLATQSAMADPTYWMSVAKEAGRIFTTDSNETADFKLNLAAPTVPDFNVSGTWDLAGYWEFTVTGSTMDTPGSNWNDVFTNTDKWYFNITWNGTVLTPTTDNGVWNVWPMPPASFNQYTKFGDMYDQWFRNNDNVYTFFNLYCAPNSACASDPNTNPVGVFAFVVNSAYANFDNIQGLMALGDPTVGAGSGIATASLTGPVVPEPTSLLLLGTGLGALGLAAWRRRK